jgi:2-iminobutanoate/2-iminopropanoate deaminase
MQTQKIIKIIFCCLVLIFTSKFNAQNTNTNQLTNKVMSKPYSPAIKSNGNLYLSGQIGLSKETNSIVTGGVVAELQQIFKNIESLLNENNSSYDKIVAVTIYLTDMKDYSVVNEEYVKYFSKRLPTRTCIAVSALPLNAKIELTVIAE